MPSSSLEKGLFDFSLNVFSILVTQVCLHGGNKLTSTQKTGMDTPGKRDSMSKDVQR